jgi:hypothetical protein
MEDVNQPEFSEPQNDQTSPIEEERRADDTDKNRRKSVVDRRTGIDRRQEDAEPEDLAVNRRVAERRSNTGLERRRRPGRRRSDHRRSAEEGEMTVEQF